MNNIHHRCISISEAHYFLMTSYFIASYLSKKMENTGNNIGQDAPSPSTELEHLIIVSEDLRAGLDNVSHRLNCVANKLGGPVPEVAGDGMNMKMSVVPDGLISDISSNLQSSHRFLENLTAVTARLESMI